MTPTTRKTRLSALAASFIGLAVVIGVFIVGLVITATPQWSAAEVKVVAAVGAAHNPLLDALCRLVDALFGPFGAPVLGIALLAWALLVTRTWQGAVRAGLLLAVPWVVAEAMKYVVERPRPEPSALTHLIVPDPFTYSYPSGHTAFAAAFVCALMLSFTSRRARGTAALIGGALVLVVGWSRVYLGVHYPTDVLAAMLVVVAVALPLSAVLTRVGPLRAPAGARVAA